LGIPNAKKKEKLMSDFFTKVGIALAACLVIFGVYRMIEASSYSNIRQVIEDKYPDAEIVKLHEHGNYKHIVRLEDGSVRQLHNGHPFSPKITLDIEVLKANR
jgi:hypothetical protein